MKKVFSAFAAALAVFSLFLFGCGKDSTITSSNYTLKVSDYDYLGTMHNDFMSNALNNLNITTTDKTKEEVLSEITAFNVDYAQKSYNGIMPGRIKSFDDFKELLDNTALNKYILGKKTKGAEISVEEYFSNETGNLEDMPSLQSMIDYLHSCGTLRNESYILLNELITALSSSIEGQISDANFSRKIDKFIVRFSNQRYRKDDIDGVMLASILSITSASAEWWQNNPEASSVESKIHPAIVADAAGAITGVVIDAIRQGISMAVGAQDCWDWGSTGWAAVGGAVDGSIGISSKVFKALKKLL